MRRWFLKSSIEWHPKQISNPVFRKVKDFSRLDGASYPDKARMYGRYRLNVKAGLSLTPRLWEFIGDGTYWYEVVPESNYERWRFTINSSYILDNDYYRGEDVWAMKKVKALALNRRWNIQGTGYYVIGTSRYSAAFARVGYIGSDYYNIYFNQSFWEFKLGLAFGFFDQPENKDLN